MSITSSCFTGVRVPDFGPPGGCGFFPITMLMMIFVTLTMSAPPKADQKLSTRKSGVRIFPTNMNKKALMTNMPKPSESRMNGSVNSTNNGFSTALNKLSKSTTAASVTTSSQWMPVINLVASVTPSASTDQRTSS